MPLHERNTIRAQINDSLFASKSLRAALPKYRFPTSETIPEIAAEAI